MDTVGVKNEPITLGNLKMHSTLIIRFPIPHGFYAEANSGCHARKIHFWRWAGRGKKLLSRPEADAVALYSAGYGQRSRRSGTVSLTVIWHCRSPFSYFPNVFDHYIQNVHEPQRSLRSALGMLMNLSTNTKRWRAQPPGYLILFRPPAIECEIRWKQFWWRGGW